MVFGPNDAMLSQVKLSEVEEFTYASFDAAKCTLDREAAGFRPEEEVADDPRDSRRSAHSVRLRILPRVPSPGRGRYVVVYTNPRGSTSYGQEFANVIQYKYPGDDAKDLLVAVDEMVKRATSTRSASA
jgi:hypothetical protein